MKQIQYPHSLCRVSGFEGHIIPSRTDSCAHALSSSWTLVVTPPPSLSLLWAGLPFEANQKIIFHSWVLVKILLAKILFPHIYLYCDYFVFICDHFFRTKFIINIAFCVKWGSRSFWRVAALVWKTAEISYMCIYLYMHTLYICVYTKLHMQGHSLRP